MPYANQVRVSSQSGGPLSGAVEVQLWEMSTVFDSHNNSHINQVDQERISVAVSGGAATSFATVAGPTFLSNNNHQIALSVHQAALPGPIFRSGRMDTLPAGAPANASALVDIMLLELKRYTMADVNAMIPTPITLPDGNTVSTVTVTSAPPSRVLTLVATGPYGATTYTYTLPFTIEVSNDQVDLTLVFEAARAGAPSITFAAGTGGGFQAFFNNLFAGMFVGQITNNVIRTITERLNLAAATAAADAFAMMGFTGGLPSGIVLGARSVEVASNGDLVILPAIGTFGSLIDKFLAALPPGQPGSGLNCFIATAAMESNAPEVQLLRQFRSRYLSTSRGGRAFIRTYETLSPPLARVIARSETLRAITRRLLVKPLAGLVSHFARMRPRR
ncbi:MAG: CFI-box-CTERM domain-containing protein [Steroidobacter sp.]